MWRRVVTRVSSGIIASASSCWWGRTSRNQPAQAATASTAPTAVTETFVSRPANIMVNPADRTSGHAVGAGTSILVSSLAMFPLIEKRHFSAQVGPTPTCSRSTRSCLARAAGASPSDDVDHGEHDHPHRVHEMPVERQHVHARRLSGADAAGKPEQKDNGQHQQTDGDVKRVQAD